VPRGRMLDVMERSAVKALIRQGLTNVAIGATLVSPDDGGGGARGRRRRQSGSANGRARCSMWPPR
jgi:hypothetical protein